jgi:RNA polymerase sigma factor (TIGR02999 family)
MRKRTANRITLSEHGRDAGRDAPVCALIDTFEREKAGPGMGTEEPRVGPGAPGDITDLLVAWAAGDSSAPEKLMPLVYGELRRLARHHLRNELQKDTLQTTGLVHEAYLRLCNQRIPAFESRNHFYAIAARLMRQILVDHARRRRAGRRQGGHLRVSLSNAPAAPTSPMDLVELDQLLTTLAGRSEQQSRIVELRYFAGLNIPETAEVLQISAGTVKRQWRLARAWLYREMGKE